MMTSYTLSAITALLGGRYTGTDIEINGVRPLDSATASHISFLSKTSDMSCLWQMPQAVP